MLAFDTTASADIYRVVAYTQFKNLSVLLVFQVFVVAATVVNWDFSKILQGPEEAWIGHYFYLNWAVSFLCTDEFLALTPKRGPCSKWSSLLLRSLTWSLFFDILQTTICYFLADLIWVARVPICVKSPDVIVKVRWSFFVPKRGGRLTYSISHRPVFFPVTMIAPYCCHRLPKRTGRLAEIPLVHGRLFVSGDQHVVSHHAPCRLQATRPNTPPGAGNGIAFLLHFLDYHSDVHLPVHHVRILPPGARRNCQNGHLLALADGVHARAFLSLHTESEVVLRSVSAHHCEAPRSAKRRDWWCFERLVRITGMCSRQHGKTR